MGLIPGVGPVLLVAGLGMLAGSAAIGACDRYFYQNQTFGQALGGGLGDATGVGALYTGFTGRDIGTGRHLGLTDAQQRQLITTGALQTAQTGLLLYAGAKGLGEFSLEGEAVAAEGKCFPGCFPAGTLISTADGLKPIETIQASDPVWAYDLLAGEWKLRSVVETATVNLSTMAIW